ncbi:glycoside hydrolase family 20 protein [Coniophora puteana RWD-64-598 SS2]|uniref:beta-N-acetylhexosaminidase n=1 Tax=Coniophora puteana (strain RWD-64-598) TaxID=741705 RepID=A0A5M3MFG3_CONPW|nr:glycoside hydrolase family 20 protein [Coniophora puteana RWD-64-598 SS2]EIW77952.1 glycoside hydrolase family 20 protein [Coniophora puteana RWD-64-598 SS2]
MLVRSVLGVCNAVLSFSSLVPSAFAYSATTIPSITSFVTNTTREPFGLDPYTQIVVDSRYADHGSPSLSTFAQTFRSDLVDITGYTLLPQVQVASEPEDNSSRPTIFLILDSTPNFTLYNGKDTDEGYLFEVSREKYVISGAAPIGTWWGTRTLLQQLVAAENGTSFSIPAGSGRDNPGWEIRGWMLDTGRHWYETSFLSDLCIYASFFKINEFHIHASDNLWIPQILYGLDWRTLYSGFRFQPPDGSPVYDLVPRRNECWSQTDFMQMQSTCAAHGVTIVPEIDTPGHSLVLSQWIPALMLNGTPDSLNLSYPETIPTIKSIWQQFLPWFSSSQVSIGADEYSASLADEYISFVNDMSDYVGSESNKSVRIWGTYEPSNTSSVSKEITIQHWDFPDGDIPLQLLRSGYGVINSEQAFLYLDGKIPAEGGFPQSLNETLLWSGAPGGAGWAPNIFTTDDATNNTTPDDPNLRGAIFALWNDWGPNATTPLETYYQLARSIALFAEKTWAGSGVRSTELTQAQFDVLYPVMNAKAPGQNLNRVVDTQYSDIVYQYDSIPSYPFDTQVSSVGPPYTLTFSVQLGPQANPSDISQSVLFSGIDSTLYASSLTMESNAEFYPTTFTFPAGVFTSVTIKATREYTYAEVQPEGEGKETYWWTTTLNIWGDYLTTANMSFAAPAQYVGCQGFEGTIRNVTLKLGV